MNSSTIDRLTIAHNKHIGEHIVQCTYCLAQIESNVHLQHVTPHECTRTMFVEPVNRPHGQLEQRGYRRDHLVPHHFNLARQIDDLVALRQIDGDL